MSIIIAIILSGKADRIGYDFSMYSDKRGGKPDRNFINYDSYGTVRKADRIRYGFSW